MNPYDRAYELARAIKASPEYQRLTETLARVKRNESAWRMVQDFRQRQAALEMDQLLGKEVPPEEEKKLHDLYELISGYPDIRAYLEAEAIFGRLMADLQKIIAEPLAALEVEPGSAGE